MPFLTQPSFTAGELAPSLQARVDMAKYAVGAKTMKNFFCHAHGGASNRAGSYYVGEVEDSDEIHRLIPFIYNSSQTYALVFGNATLRFVAESAGVHGYVESAGNPVEVVSPYASADLAELNYTQSADVMYLFHPDYAPYKLSRVSHTSWTLVVVPFVDGPYRARESGDTDILMTPGARSGNNVAVVSNVNIFAAKHVGTPLRLGYMNPLDATDIQWGYGVIDQVTDAKNARMDITAKLGYEQVFNPEFEMGIVGWEDHSSVGSIVLDPADTTLKFTMGASGLADVRQQLTLVSQEKDTFSFVIDSIQGNLRVFIGTTTGASDIAGPTTYNSIGTKTFDFTPTQSEIHITIDDTGSANGNVSKISEVSIARTDLSTADWRIGAWNATDGYPRTGGFYEQRLCIAGSATYPLTNWLSKTGDFENFGFSSPLEDSDSFSYRFDSGQVNDIQWLVPLGKLLMGTSGAEWRVQGYNGEALTPFSLDAKAQSYNGSANIVPLVIGSTIVYVQRGANAVRELTYSLEVDGYASEDLSVLANHLFTDYTVTEWAFAKLPYSIIWGVRSDGTLLGMTYMKEHDVWGWHRHITEGNYESICAVPGATEDFVYTIVNRTIDGDTKRFIEVSMPRINDAVTYDYFFVDCGLTYSGAAATTITGLDHLEGEDVAVLADGSVINGKTVTSGQITLDTAASLVHVGLPYTQDLELLGIEHADDRGTSQGRTKSIPSVSIRFENTRGAWAGPDSDHLDEMRFRDEADGEDPITLFTDNKELTFNSGYDTNGRVFIRNSDPIPITVLSVTPDVVISER